MFKTFFVLCLLAFAVAQSQVKFKADSNIITFHANWHPNIQELSQQFAIFNQHLSRKDLQKIDISFAYCIHHQFLLENLFASNFSAKTISINLDSCMIGNKGLELILERIDGKAIQALHLVLNSINITDQVLNQLGRKISQMPLRKLSVELVYNKLTDKGLSHLFLHPVSKQLEDLSLDFVFNKLTSKSLNNLPAFLQQVPSDRLKKLTFKIGSNKIQQKGAQILYESFKRFDHLQVLALDFYFNNLKAKGAKSISELVKVQINLKDLSLNFDLNYIQTEGGVALGESLHGLTALQRLSIDVSNKNFGFNGFQAIVKEIETLTNLKSLTLKAGVNRVGLKGAEKFCQAINKLNLEHLDLYLTESFITDEGTQLIGEAVSKQKHIRTIRLNLGFNEARGYGPISLVQRLSSNKYDHLWLGLSNNPLQDKEVKLMLQFFESLIKNNQKFQLEFLNTKISEEMAQQITSIFEKAKGSFDAIVHVDSVRQGQKIRDQLQKQNKNGQTSQL